MCKKCYKAQKSYITVSSLVDQCWRRDSLICVFQTNVLLEKVSIVLTGFSQHTKQWECPSVLLNQMYPPSSCPCNQYAVLSEILKSPGSGVIRCHNFTLGRERLSIVYTLGQFVFTYMMCRALCALKLIKYYSIGLHLFWNGIHIVVINYATWTLKCLMMSYLHVFESGCARSNLSKKGIGCTFF